MVLGLYVLNYAPQGHRLGGFPLKFDKPLTRPLAGAETRMARVLIQLIFII